MEFLGSTGTESALFATSATLLGANCSDTLAARKPDAPSRKKASGSGRVMCIKMSYLGRGEPSIKCGLDMYGGLPYHVARSSSSR